MFKQVFRIFCPLFIATYTLAQDTLTMQPNTRKEWVNGGVFSLRMKQPFEQDFMAANLDYAKDIGRFCVQGGIGILSHLVLLSGNAEMHITAHLIYGGIGTRIFHRYYLIGLFAGPALSYVLNGAPFNMSAWDPVPEKRIYVGPSLYTNTHFIFKPLKDLGIGICLIGNYGPTYTMAGATIIIHVSSGN